MQLHFKWNSLQYSGASETADGVAHSVGSDQAQSDLGLHCSDLLVPVLRIIKVIPKLVKLLVQSADFNRQHNFIWIYMYYIDF